MKDTDWEILAELYKNPNMTKAADLLYLTQPALTKRLQRMEAEWETRIVSRSKKGLAFTPEGEYLAQQAGKYLAFMQETRRHLQEMQEKLKAVITLGVSYTFGKYSLMDILMEYREAHPQVLFQVVSEPSSVLFRQMLDNSIDAGIINGDYEGAVNRVLLGQTQAYLVSREPMDMAALDPSLKIGYKTNDRTKELLGRWWEEQYGTQDAGGIEVGYVDVAWDLVARGAGYTLCFIPKGFTNEQHFSLSPLYYADGSPVVRNIWFIYTKNKRIPPVLEEFIKFMEQKKSGK